MDQERIGQFIKKIRQDYNLTQKEMADKLGVTFQAVSKWENGKNIPDIAILKKISDDFNVDISEILDGEKKEIKKPNYLYPFILIVLLIVLLGIGTIIYNKNDDYEFKTISSKCKDFKITGSAAYNKDKATIYISNVEFCGREDITKYKKITCTLYETYKDIGNEFGKRDHSTIMSSCERIEKLIKTDPLYLKVINDIESRIK